jgi:hypothetical protein
MFLDRYKKDFLKWGSKYVNRHLEDPSYLGFQVKFNFSETLEPDMDFIPGSLLYIDNIIGMDEWIPKSEVTESNTGNHFLNKSGMIENETTTKSNSVLRSTSNVSALHYLERLEKNGLIPLHSKTELLKGLISELIYIQNKTPWFFQSIEGLGTAYTVNHEGFRSDDKGKITIKTLESIDRRISFIIDAYRKVAWDMKSMTWMLPHNLRKFNMEVMVIEFNAIHTKDKLYELSQESFNNERAMLEDLFPGAYNTLGRVEAKTKQIKGIIDQLSTPNIPYKDMITNLFVLDLFTDVTIHIFELIDCELDVLGDFSHSYLSEISMSEAGEAIDNELPIKFKKSNIISKYSLLDYMMMDKKDFIPSSIFGKRDSNAGSRFNDYYNYYYNDRDRLSEMMVKSRLKDIAKATISGDYRPDKALVNTITGHGRNIAATPRDLLI